MTKKKLIKKLAIPCGIIAAISIIALILQIPFANKEKEIHKEEFKKYIASFMDENRAYLKDISSKFKSLPPDKILINELQSEYLIDHQRTDKAKKYLWMSGLNGEFLFGIPNEAFAKINETYDKFQDLIKADNFYRDRNDFLKKLIDNYKKMDFSQFERGDHSDRHFRENNWRFYEGGTEWGFVQPTVTTFSTPVYDGGGKLIGEMFMKVDDEVNMEKYYTSDNIERKEIFSILNIIFGVLLAASGVFLWFLLPTWVYIDANEREVKNPGIWAFFTLISFMFGLTIYLITRPSEIKMNTCPKCNGELNGTRAYCPHCGYDLANTFCRQCQYPIKPEWKFCPNCRTGIIKNSFDSEEQKQTGEDALIS